jgi:hypothetical protein
MPSWRSGASPSKRIATSSAAKQASTGGRTGPTRPNHPETVLLLADGRVCLTNNAAERALRGIAFGRKAWLFAGSDRGGERAAFIYGLIASAKLNDLDPQPWLTDALARIAGTPATRLDDPLPWYWNAAESAKAA